MLGSGRTDEAATTVGPAPEEGGMPGPGRDAADTTGTAGVASGGIIGTTETAAAGGCAAAGASERCPLAGGNNAGTVMSGRTGMTGLRTTATAVTIAAAVPSCGQAKRWTIRGSFPSQIVGF